MVPSRSTKQLLEGKRYMSSLQRRTGIVSAVLLVPALFLSATGILYVACGIEAANRLLDAMMAHTVFKLLLSPVVVLGGPLVTFALNAWKVVHLSADIVKDRKSTRLNSSH